MGTQQSVQRGGRPQSTSVSTNGWSLVGDSGLGASTRASRSLSVPMPTASLVHPGHAPALPDSDDDDEAGVSGPSTSGSSGARPTALPMSLEALIAGMGGASGAVARRQTRRSRGLQNTRLPQLAFRFLDIKCPVCHKVIPSDEAEVHLVMCLTRPRITYNEDKGECAICFEDMDQGDTIARLPCLCVYHKGCIDSWFEVRNSCPEHPGED